VWPAYVIDPLTGLIPAAFAEMAPSEALPAANGKEFGGREQLTGGE
jgi:hypothetical protein